LLSNGLTIIIHFASAVVTFVFLCSFLKQISSLIIQTCVIYTYFAPLCSSEKPLGECFTLTPPLGVIPREYRINFTSSATRGIHSFIHSFFISGTWPIKSRTDRYIQKIDYTHTHIKTKT